MTGDGRSFLKKQKGKGSTMQQAGKLRKGDKVAIVSLSCGMLGEEFCSHNIEIGVKRLQEYGLEPVFMPNALKGIEYLKTHPQARAKDLKDAFLDVSIAGIICAIGGDDTYRLLPYLMEDAEFIEAVEKHPKLFTGFSDTTINHLMFYKLGLSTYYGPNFICDLGEIANEMLPYSKAAFESYLEGNESREIVSSDIWYEEREDFSKAAVGTDRILFIETCEEKPVPDIFEREIRALKSKGVFDVIKGVLIGKPQDEAYYEEYKEIVIKEIDNEKLPIVYNVNFGHATPRCALQYGVTAKVDMKQKKIYLGK